MTLFPFMTLFSSTLTLGTFMSMSASHWLFIWMGLELNLLSFIPLLTMSSTNQESEAAMKYFLAQALGSGLILLGGILMSSNLQMITALLPSILIIMSGVLLKLGLPPCHFWYPSVMTSISWFMCLILSTWQKIIPLIILSYLFNLLPSTLIIILIGSSSFIGGLGGLNQSQLRPLMAYSSIGHLSWVMAGSLFSFSFAMTYFCLYTVITAAFMITMMFMNASSNMSIGSMLLYPPIHHIIIASILLSLGGVPPLSGFFTKWLIIQASSQISTLITAILILGSLMNLFYYLNIVFLTSTSSTPPLINMTSSSSLTPFLLLPTLFLLAMGPALLM
uniref:NADH-ubiquinone oxidoreductase chain 2 n=1 Tax=Iphione sp. YZ-2018 TaxID=2153332 RepID=A0A343W6G7_9ANNE|nr:NADH dehydrogenase subunit 2 [Iphione sp. YZ-2018]